jgi:hypothetical protein
MYNYSVSWVLTFTGLLEGSFWFIERGSHCIVQAVLKLTILLPQPPLRGFLLLGLQVCFTIACLVYPISQWFLILGDSFMCAVNLEMDLEKK